MSLIFQAAFQWLDLLTSILNFTAETPKCFLLQHWPPIQSSSCHIFVLHIWSIYNVWKLWVTIQCSVPPANFIHTSIIQKYSISIEYTSNIFDGYYTSYQIWLYIYISYIYHIIYDYPTIMTGYMFHKMLLHQRISRWEARTCSAARSPRRAAPEAPNHRLLALTDLHILIHKFNIDQP